MPPRKASPVKQTQPQDEKTSGSLCGNLTRDPELRFTANGRPVVSFSVACSERVQNEDTGEWEDTEPEFFNVNVWGQQAENCAENLLRGDRVVATGYWQTRSWEDKEGEIHTREEFTARDIGPSMLFRSVRVQRPSRSKK